MGIECSYSFNDLYYAAYGELMERDVEDRLYAVDQKERNRMVAEWADDAGWETTPRTGSDGLTYLAFCPSFSIGRAV